MAQFCEQCGIEVGWFSRRKVRMPNGSVRILCKQCPERISGVPEPSQSPPAPTPPPPSVVERTLASESVRPSSLAAQARKDELMNAFRRRPSDVAVIVDLGELSLQTGDLELAQRMYRALLLIKQDKLSKAEVFAKLGTIHYLQGEPQKAKSMLERALQLEPEHSEAKTLIQQLAVGD